MNVRPGEFSRGLGIDVDARVKRGVSRGRGKSAERAALLDLGEQSGGNPAADGVGDAVERVEPSGILTRSVALTTQNSA